MKFTQRQFAIIGVVAAVILIAVVLIFVSGSGKKPQLSGTLTVWGFGEVPSTMDALVGAYAALQPKVTVSYKLFDAAQYDETLLGALASGQGPDVFMVRGRSLQRQAVTVVPADPKQFTVSRLQSLFPTVVEQDFAGGGRVFALPLYLDTLVLYYNRDLFDRAAIVAPPATWDDFQKLVPKLRSVDAGGQLTRTAAAIGTSEKNVDVATDLLELLMLQNGAKMTDDAGTTATFAEGNPAAGLDAFRFYLEFSDPSAPAYTWNESKPPAQDEFAAGNVAMFFGYHSALTPLKTKNPFLKIGVAPMLQVSTDAPVNYADYVGLAVSRQSRANAVAWDFVVSATTNPAVAGAYLTATGRPPALRTLIAQKLDDSDLGVFSKQALTARSWYQADDGKIEGIVNDAILAVEGGRLDAATALRGAQDNVSQLMRPKQ